jgi:hypothetical protein
VARQKTGKKPPKSPARKAAVKKVQGAANKKQPMSGVLLVTAIIRPQNFPGSPNHNPALVTVQLRQSPFLAEVPNWRTVLTRQPWIENAGAGTCPSIQITCIDGECRERCSGCYCATPLSASSANAPAGDHHLLLDHACAGYQAAWSAPCPGRHQLCQASHHRHVPSVAATDKHHTERRAVGPQQPDLWPRRSPTRNI